MDLRSTFNEDARNYDAARPGYVSELTEDVIAFSGLNEMRTALEIGVGTGLATLPFLQTGCRLIAAELGENLAQFCREKFAEHGNFHVRQGDFMEMEFPAEAVDLVYSATAFHWLPQQSALQKIMGLLRPGGTVALFWNHPYPNREQDSSNQVNRRVYAKHRPSPGELREEIDCGPRIALLKEAGFVDVEARLYRRVRRLNTEQYIALLNTYSDHRAMPEAARLAFEKDMREGLNEVGGIMNIYDTQALYLARKPK